MPKRAAGVLLYRGKGAQLEVLLVHPGGPFWAKKEAGVWSLPKGEIDGDESLEDRARIELEEETGVDLEGAPLTGLGDVTQSNGKVVTAFAAEKDVDAAACRSNTIMIEWPPRSGRRIEIPEVDRAAWFEIETARTRINPAQAAFLDRLRAILEG
jgi:predicted NUDIX family NTP pyrophosphohydrolase